MPCGTEERAVFCPIMFPQQSIKGFVINTLAVCVRGLCNALHTNTEKDLLREGSENRRVTTRE